MHPVYSNTAFTLGESIAKDHHIEKIEEALKVWETRRSGTDEQAHTVMPQNVAPTAARVAAMLRAINALETKYGLSIPASKLLDVGSATGYGIWQFLLSGFRANQLYGVDLFQDRVERGREYCPGLNLEVGDGSNMKMFKDKTFDIACEQFCFVHVPLDDTQRKMAKEMLRVVKDGGFILILDWAWSSKKRQLNGMSLAKIREMFEVGTATEICERYSAQLLPPIGRPVSRYVPWLYGAVVALCPFLVGSRLTILRKKA
jgi:ubiquinone/menaquinone biosynthesis C-methylase UbiE